MIEPKRGVFMKTQIEHDATVIALATANLLIGRILSDLEKLEHKRMRLKTRLRAVRDDRYWIKRKIDLKVKP